MSKAVLVLVGGSPVSSVNPLPVDLKGGNDTSFPSFFITDGVTITIPENQQHLISGEMIIEGEFINNGEAVII